MTRQAGSRGDESKTSTLLACGAAAAPIYIVVGAAQVIARDGFDVTRHAISHLSNGDSGWIQVANFLLSGGLVLAGALGVRRRLHPGRGGTWGPILLAAWGIGLLGAGVFIADPAPGFPPGAQAPPAISTSGMLHFVFGALGFYAIMAACLVFARRFAAMRSRGWAAYSLFTGVAFFLSFAGVASGSTAAATMLLFYAAVAWTWIWHSMIHVKLRRDGEPA
jgi:hypothetical protein